MKKKKGIIGKIGIALLVLVVLSLIFGGRGRSREAASPANGAESASPVRSEENKALPAASEASSPAKKAKASDFFGTWKAIGIEGGGNYYTVEELEAAGNQNLNDWYLIVYPDKTAEYVISGETHSGTWTLGDNMIIVGSNEMLLEGGRLTYTADGEKLYCERISETPENPLAKSEPEDSAAGNAESSGTGTDSKNSERSADSISPELKEYLEAYEAFMDEYVAFMESYDSSSTTELMKYLSLIEKLEEFEAKEEEWDEAEMTEAEEQYYIEVLNRINLKMMQAAAKM